LTTTDLRDYSKSSQTGAGLQVSAATTTISATDEVDFPDFARHQIALSPCGSVSVTEIDHPPRFQLSRASPRGLLGASECSIAGKAEESSDVSLSACSRAGSLAALSCLTLQILSTALSSLKRVPGQRVAFNGAWSAAGLASRVSMLGLLW